MTADNYDKEFELDYDGRVQLSNLEFTNQQELVEADCRKSTQTYLLKLKILKL